MRHDQTINAFDDQTDDAERRADALARKVLTGPFLASFLKLDLGSKLIGIGVLAHIGGDEKMRDTALRAIAALQPDS